MVPLMLLVSFLTMPSGTSVYDEYRGVRSLAMGGAHRGVGTSNDTLFLNPAGMAIAQRFAVDLQYGFSPFDSLHRINLSVVDSKTGPLAGGFAYAFDGGDGDGVDAGLHRMYMGGAYAIAEMVSVGLTAKYFRGQYNRPSGERREVNIVTGDVGLMTQIAGVVGLGVSLNNAIETSEVPLAPRTLGGGASVTLGSFVGAADLAWDLRDPDEGRTSYRFGLEYFLAGAFPLRVGYRLEPFDRASGGFEHQSFLGLGAGYITQTGGLDAAFSQSLSMSDNYALTLSLKLFL